MVSTFGLAVHFDDEVGNVLQVVQILDITLTRKRHDNHLFLENSLKLNKNIMEAYHLAVRLVPSDY